MFTGSKDRLSGIKLAVVNQEAKVATQKNGASFSEIIAVGVSDAFVFFQLLKAACDFCSLELFGLFALLRIGGEGGI